jgi:hypothetical protein
MVKSLRAILPIILLTFVASCASGRSEPPATRSPGLVAFASEDGMARLARSTARADFPALANQFEAQYNAAFCGPTTAAIVLNALMGRSDEAPRDGARFRPDDFTHVRAQSDLTLPRYTQDNVIDKGPKKRSQVLGAPVAINDKPVRDFGYQARQLDTLLKAHGIPTRLVIVDDAATDEQIRAELVQNLRHSGDYAIVNYRRRDVGQQGGGHISPVGAYDRESDSFLVLDVNPAAAGWVWMPTATLAKGMRTFDTIENRGYILVGPR